MEVRQLEYDNHLEESADDSLEKIDQELVGDILNND
jgi:hypothetical protein